MYNSILYKILLFISIILILTGSWAALSTWRTGPGIWGINDKITWALDITNFVFWIGISHAGTFISAILLLFRQGWRTAFNRAAEAMTLISLICAALFPLIHTGRQWFSLYWLLPYPNDMGVWINFKSPLIWDYFAILSYFIVTFIFLTVGMIPDLYFLNSKTKSKFFKIIFKKLTFGWIGTSQQWLIYRTSYILLAGLSTAIVISVHSIVSFDFAASIVPGWHFTLLPPYFVAGAIYSGIAMVIIVIGLTKKILYLGNIISDSTFEKLGKLLLTGSLMILFVYLMELFSIIYKPDSMESKILSERLAGRFALLFWIMFVLNIIVPQFLWNNKLRRNSVLLIVAASIIIGMWLERFIIIYSSLSLSYFESSVAKYVPTFYELALLCGSSGLFLLLYLLFIKYFPVITIYENHHYFNIQDYSG